MTDNGNENFTRDHFYYSKDIIKQEVGDKVVLAGSSIQVPETIFFDSALFR